MNLLSISAAKPVGGRTPAVHLLNPHRPACSKPACWVAFRCPGQQPLPSIRASSLNPIRAYPDKSLILTKSQISNGNLAPEVSSVPFLGLIKDGMVTAIAAATLFFAGFYFPVKPSIAAPMSTRPSVETSEQDSVSEEEREKFLEEHLLSNPYDVDRLKNLMEIKIKSKKIPEAIEIIDRLIELEPDETEWPLLKSHLYAHSGEFELAKTGFRELVKKDPYGVEAYHGLATVSSQEESGEELENVEKMVEEAMILCRKENKKTDLRDFKLLLAQIRVLQGRYDEALKVYKELVKEEPRDFRPYLCQGIIYTLLKKNNEAEQNFEKYRRLIPKGHPYASYFDDNMIATKIFAQKMENERAMAKS